MRQRLRLGDILTSSGLLSEEQLRLQLQRKQSSPLKLGEFLIKEGVLKELDITQALSKQLGIEQYSFSDHQFEPAVAKLVEETFAETHFVCPIRRTLETLTVAMVDPMDFQTVDILEETTGLTVVPIICSARELGQLRTSLYTARDNVVIEDAEADTFAAEIQQQAEDAGVASLVDNILFEAVREGASDIHISPEKNYIQLRYRIDGQLHRFPTVEIAMMQAIASRVKLMADMDIATSRIPQDGRFSRRISGKEISVRASTVPTIHGENIVLRLLDVESKLISLDDFGIAPSELAKLNRAIAKPHGLILTTGPTGSGKTTTLYSMLQKISNPAINVMTIEDPVEYRMRDVRQLQLNSKAGMTFATGLRSMLRQDPDVIMVGEIRDGETALTAAQAALTGHLVLSTLHTNSAVDAIIRLRDIGIDPFVISSTLQVIIAQRLVRAICPACAEEWQPSEELLERWKDVDSAAMSSTRMQKIDNTRLQAERLFIEAKENIRLNGETPETEAQLQEAIEQLEYCKALTDKPTYKIGRGCSLCHNTGFKGRVAIFEVIEITEEIKHLIMANAGAHEIISQAKQDGDFLTLKDDALSKVKQGLTTFEEAAAAVMI